MPHRLSVRDKIWGMVALFVLGLVVLSVINVLAARETLLDEKKLKTRHLVEAAHGILDHYARQQREGHLTLSDAQTAAQQALKAMRYADADYFWIHDRATPIPHMVMHPTVPSLDGQVLDAAEFNCATSLQVGSDGKPQRTDGRKNLFVAFNEVVHAGGHGYVTYNWPKPLSGGGATERHYPKLSYVKAFEPWGWVVGSGIYIDDVAQLALEQTWRNLAILATLGGTLVLLAALLAQGITRRLSRSAASIDAMTSGERDLTPLYDEHRDEIGTLITSFNRLQGALLAKEEGLCLSASVFDNASEGIVITDTNGTILRVNPGFTALTGYSADEAVGQKPSLLKSGHQSAEFYAQMWRDLTEGGYWQGEISNRRKNGELYIEMLTITGVRDAGGQITHYVGIFSDVTALKEQQLRLERMAHYDALTQLPNRTLLSDRLQLALIQASRNQDILAVAFLDLDDFKPVNDRLGHETGDKLLMEVAQRLKRCVRAGDTVARLGGDEFVMLLVGLESIQEAEHAFERVLAALAEPCLLKGEPVSISASIGVTLYPLDGADPEVLLRHADQAMYTAKQEGRNRYHLFDLEHDRRARIYREWRADIRKALDAGEFSLHYQPKVSLQRGEVIGAEALIRWQHPERGLLLPDAFLPVIEGSELDILLGDWVIETALAQMEAWFATGLHLPVSVNAAASQLQEAEFVRKLAAALARHPTLPPFSLEIEILETAALEDIERISHVIEECNLLGVSFALDDFGTGYSSLTYFKRLPARVLKIDKSFVSDMLDEPDDLAIVQGVLGFTQAFLRDAIAEGVETAEHCALLRHLGCEIVQGYGIAKPMPASALPDWIAAFTPDPRWETGIDHAHYPLSRAEADHCRWVDRLEAAATRRDGKHHKPPPLDPHQCAFGRWLDSQGRDAYGHLAEFAEIDQRHRRVHQLGLEIIQLIRTGDDSAACLTELYAQRDALVDALHHLRKILATD